MLLRGGLDAASTRLGGQQQQIAANQLAGQNLMDKFFKSLNFGGTQAPAPQSTAGFYGGTSGSGYSYNPDIDTAGGYFGSSSGLENMSGGYSPY